MCDFIKFQGTVKKHETSLKFRYIFPKYVFLICYMHLKMFI